MQHVAPVLGAPPASPTNKPAVRPDTRPSDAAVAYLRDLAPRLQAVGLALHNLTEQLTRVGHAPTITADKTWQTDTGLVLARLKVEGARLQAAPSVPPEAADLRRGGQGRLGRGEPVVAERLAGSIEAGERPIHH